MKPIRSFNISVIHQYPEFIIHILNESPSSISGSIEEITSWDSHNQILNSEPFLDFSFFTSSHAIISPHDNHFNLQGNYGLLKLAALLQYLETSIHKI